MEISLTEGLASALKGRMRVLILVFIIDCSPLKGGRSIS